YKMVDVVYTWINGSDISERFKKLVRFGYVEASSWRPGREPLVDLLNKVVSADSRDRDSGELKASLRSLHQNVNWHEGRLFLVSAGTIPT
ncbi:hypothetical protein, partial [Vibrio cholerae]|uniref:hypothetical protein n=1 Tax=Vibrio cholerae TaxID=666 RepID=UPI001F3210BB